jgi:hypothetical protein
MSTLFKPLSKPVIFLFLICAAACSRPPQSDFYDAEGIISIGAQSLAENEYWTATSRFETPSLLSEQSSPEARGELTASFYIRNPGRYILWVLAGTIPDLATRHSLQIRFESEDTGLISIHRLQLPDHPHPEWTNLDELTESPVELLIEDAGFYTITFESGGAPGMLISKLHLSLNGERIPDGMGYPETTDWRMDPVIDKRLQQFAIPPSAMFGTIGFDGSMPADVWLTEMDLNRYESGGLPEEFQPDDERIAKAPFFRNRIDPDAPPFAEDEEDTRPALIYPVHRLDHSFYRQHPTGWIHPAEHTELTGLAYLKGFVEAATRPERASFELPYSVLLPEWLADPGGSAEVGDEQILQTLRVSAFLPVFLFQFPEREIPGDLLELHKLYTEWRLEYHPYLYSYGFDTRRGTGRMMNLAGDSPEMYMLGQSFLVVLPDEADSAVQSVTLPEGSWYRFGDHRHFSGGETAGLNLESNPYPLFVKAGSVIPKRPEIRPIKDGSNDTLTIDVYSGESGTFRLYEDDGLSNAYRRGEFSTIAFRYFEGGGYSTFDIGALVNGYPGQRDSTAYTIQFHNVEEPVKLLSNDRVMDEAGWTYDEGHSVLTINWQQPNRSRTVFRIEFQE